jgi:hypothetical protein
MVVSVRPAKYAGLLDHQRFQNHMTSELILLVDDEPSIIQLARMYFEGFRT